VIDIPEIDVLTTSVNGIVCYYRSPLCEIFTSKLSSGNNQSVHEKQNFKKIIEIRFRVHL
jgi:hypothetical protein